MEYLTGVSGYTKIYRAHKFSQVVTMQAKKIFDQSYNVTWDTHALLNQFMLKGSTTLVKVSPGVLATES